MGRCFVGRSRRGAGDMSSAGRVLYLTGRINLGSACRRGFGGGKESSRRAVIVIEESAEPFGFAKRSVLITCSLDWKWDDIVQPLMIAFVLMMGKILFEHMTEGVLTKENQRIETLFLDGADPAFGEGVEVGRLGWQFEGLDACGDQDRSESFGEFGVAIMEQEAGAGHGATLNG